MAALDGGHVVLHRELVNHHMYRYLWQVVMDVVECNARFRLDISHMDSDHCLFSPSPD
jgi:hypothetical protein